MAIVPRLSPPRRMPAPTATMRLRQHDRIDSESASLRSRYEQADRAYLVCRNGGAVEMSLKRWVLTRELDRVTAAANVHLRQMTAHRYSLHRRSEVTDRRKNSGLDLEVLDATTGRARSTTSLSGGEQFQASLALALGLADVVSHGGSSSGKRFEALFVDEGFGSLDPRSLEDAIEALHQLHAIREDGRSDHPRGGDETTTPRRHRGDPSARRRRFHTDGPSVGSSLRRVRRTCREVVADGRISGDGGLWQAYPSDSRTSSRRG